MVWWSEGLQGATASKAESVSHRWLGYVAINSSFSVSSANTREFAPSSIIYAGAKHPSAGYNARSAVAVLPLSHKPAMRLTAFTDYTLRSLIYLGMNRERLATIQDIAQLHNISKNHLTKVVHQLGVSGLVETVRGRNGGLRLAREPKDINIGQVVRQTEPDFFIAECFDPTRHDCMFSGSCALQRKLAHAMRAFMEVLDGLTLAEVLPQSLGTMGSELFRQPVVLYRSRSHKSEGGIEQDVQI